VDNCNLILDEDETEWSFKCPKLYEKMTPTDIEDVRFCEGCNTNVYMVRDLEQMNSHVVQGHCVAFRTSRVKEVSALLIHQGLLGIAQNWLTKEEYDETGPHVVGRKCF